MDAVAVVTGGTVIWVLAGLVLLTFGRGWLPADAHATWLWVCVAGTALGLFGIWYVRRRRNRLGRRGAARGD